MGAVSIRESLRIWIDDHTTLSGRIFAFTIQALIVLSLITFSLETLPGLSEMERHVLSVIETTTVIIFTGEYLLRLWVAKRRLGFVFSMYGLVDFVAILPFYLALGMDLRSLRVVRMLRLFRILKMVRYSRALRRLVSALAIARDDMIIFGLLASMVLYFSAVGIYYFEGQAQPEVFISVFHSLWWAVVSLTTVGYGDAIPITIGGRIFTTLVLLVGLGIVAIPTSILSTAMAEVRQKEREG
jgi:voltage-gated potassium channel